MDAKQVLEMVRNRTWLFEQEVFDVIVQALECQVAKKPENIRLGDYGNLGDCPNCGAVLWGEIDEKVCDCGQKIDWEVE